MRRYHAPIISNKDGIKRLLEGRRKIEGDHWLYTGTLTHNGYGEARVDGKTMRIGRLSLYVYTEDFNINDSTQQALHNLDCPYRHCFNPNHLHKGDNTTNMAERQIKNKNLPNFPCGHEKTESNIYRNKESVTIGNATYTYNRERCKHCKYVGAKEIKEAM